MNFIINRKNFILMSIFIIIIFVIIYNIEVFSSNLVIRLIIVFLLMIYYGKITNLIRAYSIKDNMLFIHKGFKRKKLMISQEILYIEKQPKKFLRNTYFIKTRIEKIAIDENYFNRQKKNLVEVLVENYGKELMK